MAEDRMMQASPREVKLNLSDWTWQRVRMLAAWMGLYMQDLAGHLLSREVEALWEGYNEDPDDCHERWMELAREIRLDQKIRDKEEE